MNIKKNVPQEKNPEDSSLREKDHLTDGHNVYGFKFSYLGCQS